MYVAKLKNWIRKSGITCLLESCLTVRTLFSSFVLSSSFFNLFLSLSTDVETIVQFALHEFRYGEPQRGQTMFESILTNYPKRSDLWSVYLDMMIKQGDVEPVR